ncbi:MAG: metallophosphoesterase [Thermoanaerobaculia bacterium]|nr:metallophosphoesterase [Thermoanaerobaculia bacterium]
MSAAGIAIFALVALLFLGISWASWKSYCLFHRGGRRVFATIAIGSNLFWLILPFIASERLSSAFRVARSVLGPPWFYWVVFSLVHVSLVVLVSILWFFVARRRERLSSFGRIYSELFFVAFGIITVVGIVQALVPLRVERVPVTIAGLPTELRGMRIALISDIHVGLFSRPDRLAKISRAVMSQNPDHVVVAGDFIDDDPYFVPKFLKGLEPIGAGTGVTAVLGNHEIYGDPHDVIRQLSGTRVRLLVNEGTGVLRGDEVLWLAGVSDYAGSGELKPDLDAALRGRPENAPVIVISHQPRVFPEAIKRHLPLVLAGHSHGGQFGVRWLGWSLAGVFIPYDMGLFQKGPTQMYVTTGTGYWLVPMRFGMSPEVVVIELRGK